MPSELYAQKRSAVVAATQRAVVTETLWFGKDVRGAGAIGSDTVGYQRSPVRVGMSKPPHNDRVRQDLLAYFAQNGITPEAVERPPRKRRQKSQSRAECDPAHSRQWSIDESDHGVGRPSRQFSLPSLSAAQACPGSQWSEAARAARLTSSASFAAGAASLGKVGRTVGAMPSSASALGLRAAAATGASPRVKLPQSITSGRSSVGESGGDFSPTSAPQRQRVMSEMELDQRMSSLRSLTRTHRSRVDEKVQKNDSGMDAWGNDLALLNTYHSKAMRTLHPPQRREAPSAAAALLPSIALLMPLEEEKVEEELPDKAHVVALSIAEDLKGMFSLKH